MAATKIGTAMALCLGSDRMADIIISKGCEDTVMAKRDIFGELMEGVVAMKRNREGKLAFCSYKVDAAHSKVNSKAKSKRGALQW